MINLQSVRLTAARTYLIRETAFRPRPRRVEPPSLVIGAAASEQQPTKAAEVVGRQTTSVDDTAGSWGLLLVPVTICLALTIYASLFFS